MKYKITISYETYKGDREYPSDEKVYEQSVEAGEEKIMSNGAGNSQIIPIKVVRTSEELIKSVIKAVNEF